MGLPISGTITLQDIQEEFDGPTPARLTDYYRGGDYVPDISINNSVPTSGTIKLTDFYGAANLLQETIDYMEEVAAQGGTIRDLGQVNETIRYLKDNGFLSNVVYAYDFTAGGYKQGTGDRIIEAYDLVAPYNHSINADNSERPTVHAKGFEFTPTNNTWLTTGLSDTYNTWTYLVWVKMPDPDAGNWLGLTGYTGLSARFIFLRKREGGAHRIYYRNGNLSYVSRVPPSPHFNEDWVMVGLRGVDSTDIRFFLNNVWRNRVFVPDGENTELRSDHVGRLRNGHFFNGIIGKVVLLNSSTALQPAWDFYSDLNHHYN